MVGCFPANGFGLHDMVGYVWEWTRSLFFEYLYEPDDRKQKALKPGKTNREWCAAARGATIVAAPGAPAVGVTPTSGS